jgi:pimeloyl-ACP methyl ester carboxylesterase
MGAGGGFDAVIVAGLPISDRVHGDDLELRTACPNHRKVLTASALPLADVVLPNLSSRLASLSAPRVPLLAIHGAADEVSTPADAVTRYRELGASTILVVRGGRHDILNDVSHRSVAASIVLFLEEVRDGGGRVVVDVTETAS